MKKTVGSARSTSSRASWQPKLIQLVAGGRVGGRHLLRCFRLVPPQHLTAPPRPAIARFERTVSRPKMVLRPGLNCSTLQHACGSCDEAPLRFRWDVSRESEHGRCPLPAALQQLSFGAEEAYKMYRRSKAVSDRRFCCMYRSNTSVRAIASIDCKQIAVFGTLDR